jgi:hypothetical protein
VEFLIDYYATASDVRTAKGKSQAVAALVPLLREIRDPVVRDSYLQTLGRRTGVDERVLLEALHAANSAGGSMGQRRPEDARGRTTDGAGSARSTGTASRFSADAIMSSPDAIDTKAELRALTKEEARLLRYLLLAPDQQEHVADTLRAERSSLPSTPARELFVAMLADRDKDREAGGPGRFERGRFLESLPAELHGLAIALYAERGPDPNDLAGDRVRIGVDQCLLALEADRLKAQMEYISAEIIEAEAAGDGVAKAALLETNRNLYEALKSLGRRREDSSLLTSAGGHR